MQAKVPGKKQVNDKEVGYVARARRVFHDSNGAEFDAGDYRMC